MSANGVYSKMAVWLGKMVTNQWILGVPCFQTNLAAANVQTKQCRGIKSCSTLPKLIDATGNKIYQNILQTHTTYGKASQTVDIAFQIKYHSWTPPIPYALALAAPWRTTSCSFSKPFWTGSGSKRPRQDLWSRQMDSEKSSVTKTGQYTGLTWF